MPSSFRRSLPIAGVAVLMTAALALAETPAGATPHVRPETEGTRDLYADLLAHSQTVRALVARLDASNVIVYVRHRAFTETTLDGRIGFVRSEKTGAPRYRFLIVEIACGRSRIVQLAAFAHELQHAVEIADAGEVVDARTLASHYSRIGMRTSVGPAADTFETISARDISVQVRRELLGTLARTTHDQ